MGTTATPLVSPLAGGPSLADVAPSATSSAPSPTWVPAPASALRRWVGPALLILVTPVVALLSWMIVARHRGSLSEFVSAGPLAWAEDLPMPSVSTIAIVFGWVALQGGLLRLLPGETFRGPVTPAGSRPEYRLNGVLSWLVTHALLLGAWTVGLYSASAVLDRLGEMLVLLSSAAFVLCIALLLKGRYRPSGADTVRTTSAVFDFFQGTELHLRVMGLDLKQWMNARVSMMGWSALTALAMAAEVERTGELGLALGVSGALILLYLLKFFVWEGGYFASLDITHDRLGYYLSWGVLVWVPAVYTLPTQYLAEVTTDLSPLRAGIIFAVGLTALIINYAADRQRQDVRQNGTRARIWGRPPLVLTATYRARDGEERTNLLLASGYWGLSRHFHYIPELVLAFAWTVPVGFGHLLPWTYVIFLFVLLMDRARRDDLRCADKYGATWSRYCELVPWRVLPGIY